MARRPANSTVLKYLRELAGLMGLADWTISLDAGTPEDAGLPDSVACVGVHREKSHAEVSVSPDLFRETAVEQRQYLVHELVHIHLASLDWSVADLVDHLGVRAKKVALATWEQRSERACDDIARGWAAYLPLPPWGTPTGR